MTLRFIDGFDHYPTAQIPRKWTAVVSTAGITASGTRFGTGQMLSNVGGTGVLKTLPLSGATWTFGMALRMNVAPAGFYYGVLGDGGVTQVGWGVTSAGALVVGRGTNGPTTVLGTSTNLFGINTWYYVEFKVTIHNTAGSFEARVNGVPWVSASGVNTRSTANNSANGVAIGNLQLYGGGASGNTSMDDFYILDSAGSVNNDFLGDVSIETLYPNGAGSFAGWTPSAGANWQCVDENPATDDTDYVSTTIVGTKDAYAFGNLATSPTSIKGVQVSALARKTDVGARGLALVNKSGGAEIATLGIPLTSSYLYASAIQETDPATSAAWSEAGVNAAEWGVKLDS